MNVENINKAIAIMERVKGYDAKFFYMGEFQGGDVCFTEKEILDCGTSCCFSGWLSVAPEFADYPNKRKSMGFSLKSVNSTEKSVAKLLGISISLANDIIYFRIYYNDELWGKYQIGCTRDIKPDHIIDILNRIKLGELE